MSEPTKPQHHILISIPRTASNLVAHVLNLPSQPCILPHPRDGYFFLPALSHRFKHSTWTRPYALWTMQEKDEMNSVLEKCSQDWTSWMRQAEGQNKGTWIKEHGNWMIRPEVESAFLHSPENSTLLDTNIDESAGDININPTLIPPKLWASVQTTLLTRHPLLTFPSLLRTTLDNEGRTTALSDVGALTQAWESTFRFHMLLYLFLTQQGRRPIVVDASQFRERGFAERYAAE
ncbi:hypothetical protein N0V94_009342, partial [Neodidymelliopsis sp. IMI 364377]